MAGDAVAVSQYKRLEDQSGGSFIFSYFRPSPAIFDSFFLAVQPHTFS
jgi:hypothetical protein